MRYRKPYSTERKKAAGVLVYAPYLRCSDDDQAVGDFSTITAQGTSTARHISARIIETGGEMLPPYVDDGWTGTNVKRPSFQRLLADVKEGRVQVVVATSMSRLGRGDAYVIATHLLTEAGASVELAEESFTNDLAGYSQQKIKSFLDGMYPIQVSQEVRKKQKEMVAAGFWPGGRRPFGIQPVDAPGMSARADRYGRPVPPPQVVRAHPEEFPIALRAYEMFAQTPRLAPVQRYLREVAPDANKWAISTVRSLLTCEAFIGVIQWGPNRNENAHPPLMERELWDAVQEGLKAVNDAPARSEGYTPKAPPTTPGEVSPRYDGLTYYLRGIVRCGECGALMTPKSSKGRGGICGYYECMTSNKGGKCPIARVNAYALHQVALTEIAQVGAHPTRLDWLIRETVKTLPAPTQYRDEVKTLRKKEADIEKQLINIARAIAQGAGGVSTLIAESRRLEAEREKVRASRITAEDRAKIADGERPDFVAVAGLWSRFTGLWEYLSEAERKDMLSWLVEGVTMTGKNLGELRLRVNCEPSSNWDFADIPPLVGSQFQRHRLPVLDSNQRHPD